MRYSRLIYLTSLAIHRPSLSKVVPRYLPIAPPTITRSIFTSRPCFKRDYYEVLGVSKSALVDEIRLAYFKLAVLYHPDRNRENPRAKEKFIEIGNAYEVLSNKEKRQQYDLIGHQNQGDKREQIDDQELKKAEEQFNWFMNIIYSPMYLWSIIFSLYNGSIEMAQWLFSFIWPSEK